AAGSSRFFGPRVRTRRSPSTREPNTVLTMSEAGSFVLRMRTTPLAALFRPRASWGRVHPPVTRRGRACGRGQRLVGIPRRPSRHAAMCEPNWRNSSSEEIKKEIRFRAEMIREALPLTPFAPHEPRPARDAADALEARGVVGG